MSLILLAITGAVIYAAIRTKPAPRSFESFYRNAYMSAEGASRRKKGWFTAVVDNLLGGSNQAFPPTNMYDAVVFLVVTVCKNDKSNSLFLGIFGFWIPLLAPETAASAAPATAGPFEALKQDAINAKVNHQCIFIMINHLNIVFVDELAAHNFEKAASYADDHEAADALEQAALCYKLAQQKEASARCYEKSMHFAVKLNRPAKAALLAEAMEVVVADKIRALKLAERYYDMADDRRASQVRERIANGLAETTQYAEASRYFMQRAEELSRDPVLMRAARKNVLLSMACSSLADHQLGHIPDWYVGSQEHHLYDQWFAYHSGERVEFKPTLELPLWLMKIQPSSSLC